MYKSHAEERIFREKFLFAMPLYSQSMTQKSACPASLDDQIFDARRQLQRTPEWHPEFELRLLDLIRLVDERDERASALCPTVAMQGYGNA